MRVVMVLTLDTRLCCNSVCSFKNQKTITWTTTSATKQCDMPRRGLRPQGQADEAESPAEGRFLRLRKVDHSGCIQSATV